MKKLFLIFLLLPSLSQGMYYKIDEMGKCADNEPHAVMYVSKADCGSDCVEYQPKCKCGVCALVEGVVTVNSASEVLFDAKFARYTEYKKAKRDTDCANDVTAKLTALNKGKSLNKGQTLLQLRKYEDSIALLKVNLGHAREDLLSIVPDGILVTSSDIEFLVKQLDLCK